MSYFSRDFIAFFRELESNNHKEWFDNNRKRYTKEVKEPFRNLVAALINRIRMKDPEIRIEPREAIFRINRDIRFSKDKTPYKTHVAANISAMGRRSKMVPGFYIHLGSDEVWVGGGAYEPEKQALQQLREEIASDPDRFRAILDSESFKEKYGQLKGDKNKVLPKGLKEAAQDEPLIFNKQFYYMRELDPDIILNPELEDVLMSYYDAGRPLNNYLKKAMGVAPV